MDAAPFVLGMGHQQVWVRPTTTPPKGGQKQKVPESIKWRTGVEAIGAAPPGVRWVHVGDSESDCWEAIESCRGHGSGFALRACQNRQVLVGHVAEAVNDGDDGGDDAPASQSPTLLFDVLQQLPALGHKKLWVRGRKDREARWAQLAVSATPVTLLAPKNWADKPHRRNKPRPAPLQCWAVRVHEVNTPAGEEPIEWVILTDEPVTDAATALTVVFWYACRWLIEEYHKCLKSGCRIESRQLEEADRLKTLLGILSVVAVRLLQLKHQAKVNPDAPALRIIPQRYVQTLAAHLKQSYKRMTTRTFWRETAHLGGFLGRKGDGDPGWLTLWRGWQHLELLTTGFELGERKR
jgi:hypothetical protein